MRIFIHGVDTFLGKTLVKELLYVEASNPDNTQKHRIFGTVYGKPEDAPKSVKRVLQGLSSMGGAPDPKKHSKLRETISSCSLVVIDLFSATLDDLHFAISCLKVDPKSDPPKNIGEPLGKDITFVVISSLLVWADTSVSSDDTVFRDSNYKMRTPLSGSRYEKWREMEDLVLNCFNREESTIKGIVVAPGILYGEGEDTLGPLFKSAWLGEEQTVVTGPGAENRFPTVHVRDLARLVREIGVNGKNNKGEDITTAAIVAGEDCPYYIAIDQPPAPPPRPPTPPQADESKGDITNVAVREDEPVDGDELADDMDPDAADEPQADVVDDVAVVDAAIDDNAAANVDEVAEEAVEVAALKTLAPTREEILIGIVSELADPQDGVKTAAEEVSAVAAERLREAMTLNLAFAPSELMLKENFAETCDPPGWWCKEGLLVNMRKVATEFCKESKLRAMIAIVAGPPASGKTTLANAVAEHYNVPRLVLPTGATSEELEALRDRLLASKVCRYRGYVLDCGAASFDQVEKLFCVDEVIPPEEGDEDVEPDDPDDPDSVRLPPPPKTRRVLNDALCPEFIITTQAPPELCRARWRARDEGTMEDFHSAMETYEATHKVEANKQSFTDFFQNIAKRGVMNLPIAGRDPEEMLESVRIYMDGSSLGRPFNYLKSEQEVAAEIMAASLRKAQEQEEAEKLALSRGQEQDDAKATEAKRLIELRERLIAAHEDERRKLQAIPLRAYIMEYMVPSLTEGLIEVCKVFPDDPVEYLASYLEQTARQVEQTRVS